MQVKNSGVKNIKWKQTNSDMKFGGLGFRKEAICRKWERNQKRSICKEFYE